MNEQSDKLWQGVAIITGASSGIGEAIARKLAKNAQGLVIGARRFNQIKELASSLGDHVIPIECDVRKKEDVAKLAQTAIHHFGRIDAMINNAGILPVASMLRCHVDDWENMIDTNLKGALYGIAAALPQMLEQGTGRIISISSEAARKVFPGTGVYSATKHAIRVISEGLQNDLSARSKKDGNTIKVTTIAPGVVMTNLADSVTYPPAKEAMKQSMESTSNPLQSSDIADCVEYILSTPPHIEIGELTIRPVKQIM